MQRDPEKTKETGKDTNQIFSAQEKKTRK